jgi:hypothetical protein
MRQKSRARQWHDKNSLREELSNAVTGDTWPELLKSTDAE